MVTEVILKFLQASETQTVFSLEKYNLVVYFPNLLYANFICFCAPRTRSNCETQGKNVPRTRLTWDCVLVMSGDP